MKPNELVTPFLRRITSHRAFLPLTIFVALVIGLVISTSLSNRPPVIESITPQVGYPGSILLIAGSHFGKERGSSEVTIAGIRPPSSAYLEWTNKRISVRIPQDVNSGMVYVRGQNGSSNGKLFTNQNNIPIVVETSSAPGQPHISAIDPGAGSVGTELTVTGENFGSSRGTGEVYFTPTSVSDQGLQVSEVGPKERFSGCGCDFMYSSWTDKKIVLFVPDGASSGNVSVVTDHGTSNAQYFEVTNQVGTKTFKDKRGYQIHYGAQISNVSSEPSGTIDLWLPDLSATLSQRHIESIVEPKPISSDYKGLMRFGFTGFKQNATYTVSITYYFDRYAVETRIDSTKVRNTYDTARKLYTAYTAANGLIPSNDPAVRAAAQKIVGAVQNPYDKAQLLYDFVTQKLKYSASATGNNVPGVLTTGTGDSYLLALLYTALLRAAGVPARPVAGVLVYGDKQTVDHYWVEFYLPDFGWVPTDPALGAGARYGGYPTRSDAADYYFGNLDNQHVTFTQGLVAVNRLDLHGKTVARPRSFSLQTVSEEASAVVKSYDSVWDDVRVVDWW